MPNVIKPPFPRKTIEYQLKRHPYNSTLVKTQDYLDVFARFKQKENIEAVERMLSAKQELELFERSQLGMDALSRNWHSETLDS